MSIDYDEILGVHPTAEEFVIRAAYRALARRYHPDKLGPDESGLADRMAQINEAYDALSDSVRRQEYDRSRQAESASTRTAPSLDELFDPPPAGVSFASADWEKACEYYPDLPKIDSELMRISWKLAWMFRSSLLESKTFGQRWMQAGDLDHASRERRGRRGLLPAGS
jgi:curved DNA-binding protein CbpA